MTLIEEHLDEETKKKLSEKAEFVVDYLGDLPQTQIAFVLKVLVDTFQEITQIDVNKVKSLGKERIEMTKATCVHGKDVYLLEDRLYSIKEAIDDLLKQLPCCAERRNHNE